tara:strand:+ start:100 stop:204 length:105 start_codon:yes stop_codon:yes gene_type:complete
LSLVAVLVVAVVVALVVARAVFGQRLQILVVGVR